MYIALPTRPVLPEECNKEEGEGRGRERERGSKGKLPSEFTITMNNLCSHNNFDTKNDAASFSFIIGRDKGGMYMHYPLHLASY